MRTERQFIDVVREVECVVVEVVRCAEFHIPVTAGGDVEVTLDFVAFQRTIDAAAVLDRRTRDAWSVGELAGWVGAHVA